MALLVVEDGRILADTGNVVPRLVGAWQTLLALQQRIQEEHAAYLSLIQTELTEMQSWVTASADAAAIQATIDRLQAHTVATEALAQQVHAVNHPVVDVTPVSLEEG